VDSPPVNSSQSRSTIRIILGANVLLFLAYSGVYMYDGVYAKLNAANLADPVAWGVYLTLSGSTLFAGGLFLMGRMQKLGPTSIRLGAGKVTPLDGVLLLVWSLAFGGICLYGLMLGLRSF